MERVPVDILGLSTSPASGGAFALILREVNGNRRLPIIIGAAEAQSIALEMEGIKIRLEKSPPTFYGLSHRSWGDYSDTMPILMETANPSQGRLRSKTNEELVLTGVDPWYVKAQKLGRLYVPFDESGHPMEERVGRHSSALQAIMRSMEYFFPAEQLISVSGVPGFAELMEKGFGSFLKDIPAN